MSAFRKLLQATPRYIGLLKSQYWSPERWDSYREAQLRRILDAAVRIPFYAERLGKNPRREDFSRFPILRRQEVDSLVRSVRSIHPASALFAHAESTGTSGPRADFLFDHSHQRGRYAARARYLLANGWNPIERSVWLAGAGFLNPVHNDDYDDREFVSRLLAGVRFLTNSTEFSGLAAKVAAIDPRFIYIYPSVLDGLLRALDAQRRRLPSLRRIFCGAEVLDDSIRERTRRQLGVEISENYGSTETFIAWQCPEGNLHQNAEHVWVELLDQAGRTVAAGQMGRVVLTTLENYLMPLVRYEIGDYAVAAQGSCRCGRTLPLIGRVVGRGMNLFRNLKGELLTTWELCNFLLEFPAIAQFQIVQTAPDRVVIKYIADAPVEREAEVRIRIRFNDYLGAHVGVELERVDDIPRTPGGKFMVTLSHLSA